MESETLAGNHEACQPIRREVSALTRRAPAPGICYPYQHPHNRSKEAPMIRNEEARKTLSFTERRARASAEDAGTGSEVRTIVIRHGSGWQSLAFLLLCLLLGAAVLLGHWVVRDLDRKNQETSAALARAERKMQQLESGLTFEARRRQLLLGMRNHILKREPAGEPGRGVPLRGARPGRVREVPRGRPSLPSRHRARRERVRSAGEEPRRRAGPLPDLAVDGAAAGARPRLDLRRRRSSSTPRRTPRRRPSTSTCCSRPTRTRSWSWPSTTAGR